MYADLADAAVVWELQRHSSNFCSSTSSKVLEVVLDFDKNYFTTGKKVKEEIQYHKGFPLVSPDGFEPSTR